MYEVRAAVGEAERLRGVEAAAEHLPDDGVVGACAVAVATGWPDDIGAVVAGVIQARNIGDMRARRVVDTRIRGVGVVRLTVVAEVVNLDVERLLDLRDSAGDLHVEVVLRDIYDREAVRLQEVLDAVQLLGGRRVACVELTLREPVMITGVARSVEVVQLLLELPLVVQIQPCRDVYRLRGVGWTQILRMAHPLRRVAAHGKRV